MKTSTPPVATSPAAGGRYLRQPDGSLKRLVEGELAEAPQAPAAADKTAPQKTADAGQQE